MTRYGAIFYIGGLCYLGWEWCTEGTRKSIKAIGRSPRYYPEKYVLPSEQFRKIFRLEKRRYLNGQLFYFTHHMFI